MVVIIFILSTLSFVFIASNLSRKNQPVKRRIEQLITPERTVIVEISQRDKAKKGSFFKNLIAMISKNIKTTDTKRQLLEQELDSAGILLRVEEFIAIRLVIFALGFIISLLFGVNPLIALVLAWISWKLPSLYVKRKKNARIDLAAAQLPQALETMASAMKSGFSFLQAMKLVSEEMGDPLGIEFQRTLKEINLGIPMELAFANLLERLPNKDLEIVVTAVLIQRSTGGNLAQILETIHSTIFERVRMKDELRALTAQGRMSAIVISLLPVILGLLLNLINPEYFRPMLSHPLGWILLGGGLFSGILGWIFIQKVVTIEV